MRGRIGEKLSYGNIVATLALFVALGGTSYAVATGSIDSREIKNSAVRSADIRNNDVRGRDVRDGTLGSADVGNGSLLAADFAAGQLPAGRQGDEGIKGDVGPTAAAASAAGTPPADPQQTAASTTITAPVAGKLMVFAHQPDIVASSPGAVNTCVYTWALYVDDQPVPGSARSLSAEPGQTRTRDWTLLGVSGPVSAGAHEVAVMTKSESVPGPGACSFGSGDAEDEPAQVGAVLVGG